MIDTERLLNEREKTHGEFFDVAATAQSIKSVLVSHYNYKNLDPVMSEALDMMASKIARILCGDPRFTDHWVDLVGYPQLVVRFLNGVHDA